MKTVNFHHVAITAILMFIAYASHAQGQLASTKDYSSEARPSKMKTFIIKRDIPAASKLTKEELKAISQTSCSVLKEMGPKIEWVHSYVTGDQIFCIYKAENEELIREHAKKGGFPVNAIIEVSSLISPATAQ